MVDLFTEGFELYSLETITSSKFKLPLLLNVLFGVTEAPFDSDSGSFPLISTGIFSSVFATFSNSWTLASN